MQPHMPSAKISCSKIIAPSASFSLVPELKWLHRVLLIGQGSCQATAASFKACAREGSTGPFDLAVVTSAVTETCFGRLCCRIEFAQLSGNYNVWSRLREVGALIIGNGLLLIEALSQVASLRGTYLSFVGILGLCTATTR